MKHPGPIIIVDDDLDDHYIAAEVIQEMSLPNQLLLFTNGQDVLDYLLNKNEQPFIILADINMHRMTGIELKKKINDHETLRSKNIPVIYYSTSASPGIVTKAFEEPVQGFFTKSSSLKDIKACFKLIFDYWSESRHPYDFQPGRPQGEKPVDNEQRVIALNSFVPSKKNKSRE